ncbi:hypothetical protein ACSFBM_30895 [Variovorax sp. GB1R11]|uniref:hypothetical protein n=1 Tax=Variovorax sp. GB1R11 TaxID=3443741 RepID=UPI003F4521AF
MPFSIEPMNSRASGSAAPVAAGARDEALDREEAEDGGEDFELATTLRMTLMENKYRSLALRDVIPNGSKVSGEAGAIQRQQRAARRFFSSSVPDTHVPWASMAMSAARVVGRAR